MNAELFFASAGDERATPQALFDALHAEFGFTLDAAAGPLNHKCDVWFGDGGVALDGLTEDWGGEGSVVWLNPPYSAAGSFVAKAAAERYNGVTTVLLLPARTDTRWWHDHIWDREHHTPRPGVEVRFVKGRVQFELHVSQELRTAIGDAFAIGKDIKDEQRAEEFEKSTVKMLVESTGLPAMAVKGIRDDKPDEDLLSGAPFPSVIVVFRGVSQ